jgi:hypothetical protein
MASHKFVVCLLVAAVCLLSVSADEKQTHLLRKRQIPSSSAAVDAALRNPRFVRRQISCLLAESPCDNIGRSLKRKFYHSRTSFPCCPTSNNFLLVLFFRVVPGIVLGMTEMTPALLRGQCPGCSSGQFQQAMKVMTYVSRQYPEEYSRIYYSYIQ